MTKEEAQQTIKDNVSEIQRLIASTIKMATDEGISFEIDVPASSFLNVLCDGHQMCTYDDAYDRGWVSSNC